MVGNLGSLVLVSGRTTISLPSLVLLVVLSPSVGPEVPMQPVLGECNPVKPSPGITGVHHA